MKSTPLLLGVEIGATKLQAALGHPDGTIVEMVHQAGDHEGGGGAIRRQVRQMIETLLESGKAKAIGIGFGGPVDYADGRVIKSNQVADWEDFPLAAWAEQTFGLPCRVGNDTDTAALAEATFGAGRECHCTFYTNIGSGIGGGLVKEGRLYTGPLGAMEFGHTLGYSPLLGRFERLEHLCSGWAIGHRARAMAREAGKGLLLDLAASDPDSVNAQAVAGAWQNGDAIATRLMEDVIETFARALCNVIALLNPNILIVGGGVALVGAPLFDALNDAVGRQVYKPFAKNFTIAPAQFAERSVPVGAMLLAAEVISQQ